MVYVVWCVCVYVYGACVWCVSVCGMSLHVCNVCVLCLQVCAGTLYVLYVHCMCFMYTPVLLCMSVCWVEGEVMASDISELLCLQG